MQTPKGIDTEIISLNGDQGLYYFDPATGTTLLEKRKQLRLDKGDYDKFILPLANGANISGIETEAIVVGLKRIQLQYGNSGLKELIDAVIADDGITDLRKSRIVGLGHFVLYKVDEVSVYLLHALNFANKSGKVGIINEWADWLKRNLNLVKIELLVNTIGKESVQSGMISNGELRVIREQLIIPIACGQALLDFGN